MDPELGRWLSMDPIPGKSDSPQTLERYVYCANNPLRFTDPAGRMMTCVDSGGGSSEVGSLGTLALPNVPASSGYRLYPYGSIGVGESWNDEDTFSWGADVSIVGVMDIYHLQEEEVEVGHTGIYVTLHYIPVYYYFVLTAGYRYSPIPELKIKTSAGEVPMVFGAGLEYADMSQPKSLNGGTALAGWLEWSGGKEWSTSSDFGLAGSYTSYAGCGYYIYFGDNPALGAFIPPQSWFQTEQGRSTSPGPGGR
jgi:hypothetical protein